MHTTKGDIKYKIIFNGSGRNKQSLYVIFTKNLIIIMCEQYIKNKITGKLLIFFWPIIGNLFVI